MDNFSNSLESAALAAVQALHYRQDDGRDDGVVDYPAGVYPEVGLEGQQHHHQGQHGGDEQYMQNGQDQVGSVGQSGSTSFFDGTGLDAAPFRIPDVGLEGNHHDGTTGRVDVDDGNNDNLVDPDLNGDMAMQAQVDFEAAYGGDDNSMSMPMSDPSGSSYPDHHDVQSMQYQPRPDEMNINDPQLDPSSGPSRTTSNNNTTRKPRAREPSSSTPNQRKQPTSRRPSTKPRAKPTNIDGTEPAHSSDPNAMPSAGDANQEGEDPGPLSEDEIKRRQNRSRASGRVLPRGQACDFCKRRKLRCNAEKPVCDHCQKNPLRVCTYTQKVNPKSRVKALSERVNSLESKLGKVKAEELAAREAELAIRAAGGIPSVLLPSHPSGIEYVPSGSASPGGSVNPWLPTTSTGSDLQGMPSGGLGGDLDGYPGFGAGMGMGMDTVPIPHDLPLEVQRLPTPEVGQEEGHVDEEMEAREVQALEGDVYGMEDQGDRGGEVEGTGVAVEAHQEVDIEGSGDRGLDSAGTDEQHDHSMDPDRVEEAQEIMALDQSLEPADNAQQPTSGAGTQSEPYLMTLANAAETAGDQSAPINDSQAGPSTSSNRGRSRADRSMSASVKVPELPPIVDMEQVMTMLSEIEARLSGVEQELAVERASDHLVNDLLQVFEKRAFFYKYTRSIARWQASLNGPLESRPSKCLMYAVLAMTASSSPAALTPSVRRFPISTLATHFLITAQREFAIAIVTRSGLLDAIQACVFLVQTLYSQGRMLDGWLMAGQGIKLAIACGLHQLGSKSTEGEGVETLPESGDLHFDFNVVVGEDGVPVMADQRQDNGVGFGSGSGTGTGAASVFSASVLGRAWMLPPSLDAEETNDRIQLFWSLIWFERAGCLSTRWPSAINDSDITTPLPVSSSDALPIDIGHGSAQTLTDLISSTGISPEVAKHDGGWTYMLKSMALLYRIQRLLDSPPSSPNRDAEKLLLRSACEAFWSSLPEDAAVHPPTGRNKRAFAGEVIFVWVVRHTINLLLLLDDGVQNPEGIELLTRMPADDPYIEAAKNVVRLARTLNTPDYVKPDLTFTILFSYTGTFLAHRSQQLWNAGRTMEAKGIYVLVALMLDTMKGLGRHVPLANVEVGRIEGIRRAAGERSGGGGEGGDGQVGKQGVMGMFVVSEGMV